MNKYTPELHGCQLYCVLDPVAAVILGQNLKKIHIITFKTLNTAVFWLNMSLRAPSEFQ